MVTFLAVILGWEMNHRHNEKKAVIWVEEMGGYAYADPFFIDGDQRNWWEKTTDRCFGERVRNVELTNYKRRIDLSPLAAMKKLESLYLEEKQMSDLSPLAELKNLKDFHLNGSRVTDTIAQVYDLSPLAELQNLKILAIHNAEVRNLSPLAGLKNLEELSLTETPVNDLSPLIELKKLKLVYLVTPGLISEDQVHELREALPNCRIEVWNPLLRED